MNHTPYIGRRVELVSMDLHAGEISVALYLQKESTSPAYLIHSYSSNPIAASRIAFLERALQTLGGLEPAPGGVFRFPCGHAHLAATRRVFLEAAKLPSGAPLEARPLTILDKKSNLTVTVLSLPNGQYQLSSSDLAHPRMEAIANGLQKLAELAPNLTFPCAHNHDAAIGLLLPRALNVRAILREEEANATRGVLVAPSAQKE